MVLFVQCHDTSFTQTLHILWTLVSRYVHIQKVYFYIIEKDIGIILGESNTGGDFETYGCAFYEMIKEWRRIWSENSGTDPQFPFGFVQLAQVNPGESWIGFPMIRWYQTYGVGYVPNYYLKVRCQFLYEDKF